MKNKSIFISKAFVIVFLGVLCACTITFMKRSYFSKNVGNVTDKLELAYIQGKSLLKKEGYNYLEKDEKHTWDYYTNNSIAKNAAKFVITPTPDKTGQANHPDMVYFKNGFNGYKYWMACTPYAFSIEKLENPIILVSNDGLNFVFPNGEHNTVEPAPADFKSGGHFSDTDLLYNQGKFIMHYVYNKRGVLGPSKFYRISSIDGVHWSKPQLVYKAVETDEGYSPGLVIDNNITNMWYIGGQGHFVYTQSKDDEKTWSKIKKCDINMGVWKPWHVDVIKDNTGYEGLMCARNLQINTRALFYIRSNDGVKWKSSVNPILFPTKKGWDNIEIYRSTMIKDKGTYRIWYSARGKGERWHIGYTEIKQSQLKKVSMS